MMIFFIIAAAIIVILLCREAILHKGNFFEKTLGRAAEGGDAAFPEESSHADGLSPPAAVDGTLRGDPLYHIMHLEEYE